MLVHFIQDIPTNNLTKTTMNTIRVIWEKNTWKITQVQKKHYLRQFVWKSLLSLTPTFCQHTACAWWHPHHDSITWATWMRLRCVECKDFKGIFLHRMINIVTCQLYICKMRHLRRLPWLSIALKPTYLNIKKKDAWGLSRNRTKIELK